MNRNTKVNLSIKNLFMYGETKKLQLIEEILKIENDAVLEEVGSVITKSKLPVLKDKCFSEFAGI